MVWKRKFVERIAYNILNRYSADYVNIHNGFNFELRHLVCWSAGDDDVEDAFEERRLGNVGVGIFWKLENGSMIVDSIYDADKNSRLNWIALNLKSMCERFDLTGKEMPDKFDIDPSSRYDHTRNSRNIRKEVGAFNRLTTLEEELIERQEDDHS